MIVGVKLIRRQPLNHLAAPATLAASIVAMFHSVLFQSSSLAASNSTDLTLQFVPWRAFGFSELRHGHLPLWNPYVFGGAPYFAGFQSALLYPPNWLHLFLPLYVAINWIIVLHVFLAGYFTSLWARSRGAGVAGSILAGSMFMFGGTYFLHVYAGHLPHLCLMAWLPLLFLTIEKLAKDGSLRWCWLGIIVMSMIILAGHPQYVFYTGIISVIYTALLLPGSASKRVLIGGYVIVMIAACGLTAVQLLSGMELANESVRSGGMSIEFASTFALPPENLLTFLVPDFFGRLPTVTDPSPAVSYFGRCYLWEMSVFVTVTGLVLACYCMIVQWRLQWRAIVIVLITLSLALGKHLPWLYQPLFNYLPMYGSFRVVAKFTVFFTLFLSVLAADGYQLLLRRRNAERWPLFPAVIVLLAGATFAWAVIVGGDSATWADLLRMIRDSKESYFPAEQFSTSQFSAVASTAAMHATLAAGAVLLLVAGIVTATRFWQSSAYALLGLVLVESFCVAHQTNTTSNGKVAFPDAWLQPIQKLNADERVLNFGMSNNSEIDYQNQGLLLNFRDVWGYDPGVLKRYAELMAMTQGIKPQTASQYLTIRQLNLGWLQLLRCKLILLAKDGQATSATVPDVLPRAYLLPAWTLSSNVEQTLATIVSPGFDPHQTVLLESPPPVLPAPGGATGPAEVTEIDSDTLEIRARSDAPTMLLIGDNYSTGWEANAMDTRGTTQSHYDIQPADHALMAIALESGTHHIRLRYRPAAFNAGAAISTVSLIAYITSFGLWIRSRRQTKRKMRVSPADIG